jgi:hypothetical protein
MTDLTGQIGLCMHGTTPIAKGIEWATDSHTHHVFVIISSVMCVSAEPGGVRYRPLSYFTHAHYSDFDLTEDEKEAIVDAAHSYVGAPYNFAIYPPLLFQKLTGRKVDGWVAEWLSKRPNENCSQLSDDIYTKAGFHLFPDIAEIVTPGDFERLFAKLGMLDQKVTP